MPQEVALMLKVKGIGQASNTVVDLLDWYELPSELILILERPVSCMDLFDYLATKAGIMHERKAQVGCCWVVSFNVLSNLHKISQPKFYVLIRKLLCLDEISRP